MSTAAQNRSLKAGVRQDLLDHLVYLARTVPLHRLAAKAFDKATRWVRHRVEAGRLSVLPDMVTDAVLDAALAPGPKAIDPATRRLEYARRPRWPYHSGDTAFLDALTARFGGLSDGDREEAAAAAAGRLRLPGGVFADFGNPPRWLRDPVSGYVWPPVFWKRVSEGRHGVDMLNTWWAGSFYHFIPLGKASAHARRVGDLDAAELYAKTLLEHVASFRAQNPYGFGPHWRPATMVALRLLHLIWGHALIANSVSLDDAAALAIYKDVYRHAKHIRENLEWFEVRTNHYLTNIYALYIVGTLYPEFREAEEWRAFGRDELIREVDHHINADGAAHEGSLNYHRFVLEIFLTALVFAKAHGDPFPTVHSGRLELGLDFLVSCLRPDGTLPRVGDAADIRLQHLDQRDYIADAGHVFNLGAVLFGRTDLKAAAPDLSEHALWLLGPAGATAFDALTPKATATPRLGRYPKGGFATYAGPGGAWVLFRAGPLALEGVAGHGHYDQLSFELWLNGRPLLIDPGWFRYESEPDAFKYFKSTAAHNTVVVDGRDQIAHELFIYPPLKRPTPRLEVVSLDHGVVTVGGAHELYSDLSDPVLHRRRITLDPAAERLEILDNLQASEAHTYEWSFHFAPDFKIDIDASGAVHFTGTSVSGLLACANGNGAARVKPRFSAPIYGERVETSTAHFFCRATGTVSRRFTLSLTQPGRDA